MSLRQTIQAITDAISIAGVLNVIALTLAHGDIGMARDTWEEHLRRSGATLDLGRITEFAVHRGHCQLCSSAEYAYIRCTVGARLAREAVRPVDNAISK